MLEKYFVKPETVDRIRGSWIGSEIESYVGWLAERRYGVKSIWRRVPLVVAFGEFAREAGAQGVGDLPVHVDAFVSDRVTRLQARSGSVRSMAKEVRGPVEQMLSVVLAGFERSGRSRHAQPFAEAAPGFFDYLVDERGLRPASVKSYLHHLDRFEAYLQRIGVERIGELSESAGLLHQVRVGVGTCGWGRW